MEWHYSYYPPELYHHGILGQKWGIRRYQNADGTLTPEGRIRYKIDKEGNIIKKTKAEVKKSKEEYAREKNEKQKKARLAQEKETYEEKKERIKNSHDPKLIYDNRDMFSYQELNELYTRLNLERNLSNLLPTQVDKGRDYVNNMNTLGNKLDATASAIDKGSHFYNSIAKVSNAFMDSDLPIIGESRESNKDKMYKKAEKEAKYYQNLYNIEKSKQDMKDLNNTKANKIKNKKYSNAERESKYYRNLLSINRDRAALEKIKKQGGTVKSKDKYTFQRNSPRVVSARVNRQ